jgi:AraC-like DNA-binding protein
MRSVQTSRPPKPTLTCLANIEQAENRTVEQATRRIFRALPFKERCILNLVYHRGATVAEIASLLGMSRSGLTRILLQALGRTSDPSYQNMVDGWDRLTLRQRRLLYLNQILGVSLRQIVRDGLMNCKGSALSPDTEYTLRREVREAMRGISQQRGT